MENKDWRVKIGSVLNNNRVDILSKDGSELLDDLQNLVERGLDKAGEGGYEKGVKDGIKGKVFNKVEIKEEAHIPKELIEKITVKRRIHEGYKELENSPYKIFGKYQYIYTSDKGGISLIKLVNYFRDGKDLWEIYCLEGKLFEDVERFNTKKEAVVEIKKYLN